MRITSLIIITILLISCKESRQDKIARLVDEWNGMERLLDFLIICV